MASLDEIRQTADKQRDELSEAMAALEAKEVSLEATVKSRTKLQSDADAKYAELTAKLETLRDKANDADAARQEANKTVQSVESKEAANASMVLRLRQGFDSAQEELAATNVRLESLTAELAEKDSQVQVQKDAATAAEKRADRAEKRARTAGDRFDRERIIADEATGGGYAETITVSRISESARASPAHQLLEEAEYGHLSTRTLSNMGPEALQAKCYAQETELAEKQRSIVHLLGKLKLSRAEIADLRDTLTMNGGGGGGGSGGSGGGGRSPRRGRARSPGSTLSYGTPVRLLARDMADDGHMADRSPSPIPQHSNASWMGTTPGPTLRAGSPTPVHAPLSRAHGYGYDDEGDVRSLGKRLRQADRDLSASQSRIAELERSLKAMNTEAEVLQQQVAESKEVQQRLSSQNNTIKVYVRLPRRSRPPSTTPHSRPHPHAHPATSVTTPDLTLLLMPGSARAATVGDGRRRDQRVEGDVRGDHPLP